MRSRSGFDAALAQVARNTSGPLAAGLARALQEMQTGKSRTGALRSMAGRTTAPELRAFVSALVQAWRTGHLHRQLATWASEGDANAPPQRAGERARKVPAKILFPLIFCLFPVPFVVITAPAAITVSRLFFHH